jgi:hypothetical protein
MGYGPISLLLYIETYLLYNNILLPVALCGDEAWFLILKEKCRLSVFENRVFRKMFGIKGNEAMEEWQNT